MAQGEQTRGACAYCGRRLTRSGMGRHLASCEKRRDAIAAADQKRGKAMPLVHLQVQPDWGGEHWLHLEVNGTATLADIDDYLRVIWLDCCGHLSEFFGGRSLRDEMDMDGKVADVFLPGVELRHVYDFGTESVTLLKAAGARTGRPTTRHPVALMARNELPAYTCQECGAPATRLCMECAYEYDEENPGTLCPEHAESHPHDDYGEPMPLVNSPRLGLCGYDGPAEPPY